MADSSVSDSGGDPVWQAARNGDRDRYFTALLAPAAERRALMAVAAFSGDLAAVAETSSDLNLGEIRLQFWRDALDCMAAGEPAGTPVGEALAAALAGKLALIPLVKGVVDARAFDIRGGAMPDAAAARTYFEKTQATLFRLALHVLGHDGDQALEAARLVGLAYGQTRAICLFRHDAARGRLFLPQDLLQRHGLSPREAFEAPGDARLAAPLAEWRVAAASLADQARAALAVCPPRVRRALLPFALTHPELALLARAAQTGQTDARLTPLGRLSRLLWAAFRGRF